MQITVEFLAEQRKGVEEQRLRALAALNQTTGALTLLDMLAAQLGKPEPETPDTEEPPDARRSQIGRRHHR